MLERQFFPGTQDWTQATPIAVDPSLTVDNVNFNVSPRSRPAVSSMQTYAYLGAGGQVPVAAPYLPSGTRIFLVFYADGTVVNNQVAPGLIIRAIGDAGRVESATLAYNGSGSLRVVVDANAVSATTPVALAVTLNNDLYVLPAGFTVIPAAPPVISSVSGDAEGNRRATVAGSNLSASTRIVLDGMPASLLHVNEDGSLLVAAPPAPGGHQAAVEALNADGQTSLQARGSAAPPQFTYPPSGVPALVVSASPLVAGTDAMVQIDGVNTNFIDGQTSVGFGSSDITVQRAWVVNPGRLLVNVRVNAQVTPGVTPVSVATGLELTTQAPALQVNPAGANQLTIRTPIINQVTGLSGVPVGGYAILYVPGTPQNLAGWTLTIGGQPATFFLGGPNVILAQVPAGLLAGPAVVQLSSPGGDYIPPVLMQVDPPPPVIISAVNSAGTSIDSAHAVYAGDSVTFAVAGFGNLTPEALRAQLQTSVGGVQQAAASVIASTVQAGVYLVQVILTADVPYGPQTPVTMTFGTRVSAPYSLFIRTH